MDNINRLINKIDNQYVILAIILVLAFIIRILHLNFESLWTDEMISAYASNPNISLRRTYDVLHFWDQTPPLYPVMLWVWLKITGFGEFQIRLFSVIGGILSIASVYFLIKEIYNRRTAYFIALILTFLPYHIYFSREARSYIWSFLITTLVLLFFFKQLKNYQTGTQRFLFVILGGILMLTSYFSFFILSGLVFVLLVALLFKMYPVNIKSWMLDFIGIGLLFTPWLYQFIRILGFHNGENGSKPSLLYLFKMSGIFSGTFAGGYLLIILYILLLISFIYLSYFKNKSTSSLNLFYLSVLLFISVFILLFIKSMGGRNILNGFTYSYVIILFPVFLIILGGLVYQSSKTTVLAFITLFLAIFFLNREQWKRMSYYKVKSENYRELATYVSKSEFNNKPIVCSCPYIQEFYFYQHKMEKQLIDLKNESGNLNNTDNDYFWIIDTYDLKADSTFIVINMKHPLQKIETANIKPNTGKIVLKSILAKFN